MSNSLFKTCEKRLRYTPDDDRRLDALLATKQVARYKTEIIRDAMRLGLDVLEQRYLNFSETEGAEEGRQSA